MFAYLDVVYAVAEPTRIRIIYDKLAIARENVVGIQLNEDKTRVWNRAGGCAEDMEVLGADVWSPDGVKLLGTPVGTDAFVAKHVEERLAEEKNWPAVGLADVSAMRGSSCKPLAPYPAALPVTGLRAGP